MMDVNWQALINIIISNFSESQGRPQTVGLLGDVLTHQTKPNHTKSNEQALCCFIWNFPGWLWGATTQV